jgi:osmoprotectant transport system substrate-binding protein
MRRAHRVLLAAIVSLSLVAAACGDDDDDGATPATSGGDTTGAAGELAGVSIKVGSANFPESVLLANIYAGALTRAGADTSLDLNIGSREVYYTAIGAGEIDLIPEYTNSLLSFVLRQDDPQASPTATTVDEQITELTDNLPDELTVLTPSTAEDKDVIVCNRETTDEFGLTDLSSLAEVAGQIKLGGPPEFAQRSPFGLPGLSEFYGAQFLEFVPLEIGPPIVDALNANAINCGNLFSTDAAISTNDLTALEDDKNIVPAEAVLPLIRADKATPAVTAVLDEVSAALTTESLTALNARVQAEGLAEEDVAEEWLTENGFGS